MKKPRKRKSKKAGYGFSCQSCGSPLYVVVSKPKRNTQEVVRLRRCRVCGWERRTLER